MKPAGSVFSEMFKLLNVFLSIESRAETSLLSIYSISGLLKESQVDIVSSKETDISFDLLGEVSMLPERVTVGAAASSGCGKDGAFGKTSALDLIFDKTGSLFPEIAELLVDAGKFFFVLTILVAHGTFSENN